MKLYGISYSPWSAQARWALEHHHIDFDWIEYVPMLGLAGLRLATRKITGRVTAPTLIDQGRVFDDSWLIARHADHLGHATRLFPADHLDAIRSFNTMSESVKYWGRVHATLKVENDENALIENLPGWVPEPVRHVSKPVAKLGARYIVRKYGFARTTLVDARDQLRLELNVLRDALDGQPTLLPEFSYADICSACSLQFVEPVDHPDLEMGPENRRCFTIEDIADEFRDVLDWRDDVFRRFRTK